MPVKSVREMGPLERKRHSLEAKTFRAMVVTSVILGIILLIIGLGLYAVALIGQYADHAFYLSQYASMSASHGTETTDLAEEIMAIYRNLSPEERAKCGTEEYRAMFAQFEQEYSYDVLIHMLPTFARTDEVSDVYVAMFDRETGALVYMVDPQEENHFNPGEWEEVEEREIRKFLEWDGNGKLYDISYTERYGWMCTAGTPLRNDQGEVCCFLLVDVTVDNVWMGIRAYALQITVALFLTMVVLSGIMIRNMRKTLVYPINEIAEAATGYMEDRAEGRKDMGRFAALHIQTGDEVENLSLIMADMERELTNYAEHLTRITAEKERSNTELQLATRIQADMLPNIFPPYPERSEFDIYASMDPAREVGGDFYDFFLIDDDHLCLSIADVSGKGVPAALFMMASKIILANHAMNGKSPAEILYAANAAICPHNREEMFVTVWLGILEISTGILTAANAGHEYPVIKGPDGKYEMYKDRHGMAIGAMDGAKYTEYTLQLTPGSSIFVYTDGVPEASDGDKNQFGMERMLRVLNAEPDADPEKVLINVRREVDAFVKGAEQFDDLTMLCLEYRGTQTE